MCPAIREADAFLLVTPAAENDFSAALRSVAANANAARVTLYPIDGAPVRGAGAVELRHMSRRWVPSPSTVRLAPRAP